jgi:ribosomal protein S18 acetylase RimI-like enzyme
MSLSYNRRSAGTDRSAVVGAVLFEAVLRYALERAATHIDVETQNINVAACRFYASVGCELTAIEPDAYPNLPNETRLIWSRAC